MLTRAILLVTAASTQERSPSSATWKGVMLLLPSRVISPSINASTQERSPSSATKLDARARLLRQATSINIFVCTRETRRSSAQSTDATLPTTRPELLPRTAAWHTRQRSPLLQLPLDRIRCADRHRPSPPCLAPPPSKLRLPDRRHSNMPERLSSAPQSIKGDMLRAVPIPLPRKMMRSPMLLTAAGLQLYPE